MTEHWSRSPSDNRFPTVKELSLKLSKALPVHNRGSRLVILTLRNPHLLEGAQRGKNGSTDPDRVLAFWRGHDLDLHRRRRKGSQLLRHALPDALEHRRTARQHNI